MANVKPRETGAAAVVGRTGAPEIKSATGGTITLNRGATDPSFSPVDLLYAAVAGCLVVSARTAAAKRGALERITAIRARVDGEKATEGPPRIARLLVHFEIEGDLDEATRAALIAEAEVTCTVSNTLRASPEFVDAD